MKASANEFPYVQFLEGAAPSTPGAGVDRIYFKTDSLPYFKTDTGAETAMVAGVNRDVVSVLTPAAGVVTIDYSSGNYFTLDPTANVTSMVFDNLPSSPVAITLSIVFTQDTTPRTVAWPAEFIWAGGTPGAVSTGSGDQDLIIMTSFDQGTTFFANIANAYS